MRNKQRQPELGRNLSPSEKRFLEGLRKDQQPSFEEKVDLRKLYAEEGERDWIASGAKERFDKDLYEALMKGKIK